MSRLALAALFAAFALPAPAAAQLSPAERTMIETVDAKQDETVDLLARIVNINSGTMNHEGVRAVGRVMAKEFDALGFATEWVEAPGTDRAGHLIARHAGDGTGKRLLLIGHLDTVFEPDSPFQRWERDGNFGQGPGAGDDKGGIVTMLLALQAMKAAGTLDGADIVVVLMGDEEDSGEPQSVSRAALIAAAEASDIAIGYEGLIVDDGKDMGSVARRSAGSWTVTVTARSGHSSGIFSDYLGNGAVFEAARIIDDFREKLRYGEDRLTYNVGLIVGGEEAEIDADKIRGTARGKTNIIAPIAYVRGDMRAMTLDQIERTQAAMRAIVAENLPGTEAAIEFDEYYPPMPPTAGNRAILDALNEVNADLGLPAMDALDPLRRGAADISFVAHLVDGLAGMGPASRGDHTPEEAVDIASIWRQAKRSAILLSRLADTPR
ncbi:M20/M25/M40 family metallo-hydrolase [Sphingomicrobium nitratireducens]|uniref:M20/M25/M40 family metallo-hydrolase n=1 Tax=Sphingomicrobium nitratireducens TaxID=2964666 RepID=UPI00223EA5B3|nr:M20/M25/M40 family metallo-hydrolase [Sphingomicrobium nitratireducens]